MLHSISRADAVALLTEAGRALTPGGRVLVTDFGTAGPRFPRGWATRGFAVVAKVLSGPTHAGNAVGYLRHGGLGPLVAEAGLTTDPCTAPIAPAPLRGLSACGSLTQAAPRDSVQFAFVAVLQASIPPGADAAAASQHTAGFHRPVDLNDA